MDPETPPPDQPLPIEQVQAHKMDLIGRLAPGVLHDLNNPLAAIHGFSELLRRDPRLPEDMKQQAGLLVDEAIRTRRLIQATFDFMRHRPPERHTTTVRTLVDTAVLLIGYRLGSGGADLALSVADDLPPVDVDRGQLLQVLLALADSSIEAIRASGAPGRVRIDVTRGEATVRISVAHDAPGAPVPDLRVPSAIVAAHGGELRVEGGRDGRGALFTFELPVHAVAPAEQRVPTEQRSPTEPAAGPPPADEPAEPPRRILVLDDERPIRLLLEKWLRGAGFEPVIASRGEEAVELVEAGPFDAVLCDHRMAGMSGTQVFDAVVALRPELARRFVFMSGDVLNPQLRDFIAEHEVGLLAKPFDLETVQRTLESVLP